MKFIIYHVILKSYFMNLFGFSMTYESHKFMLKNMQIDYLNNYAVFAKTVLNQPPIFGAKVKTYRSLKRIHWITP